MHSVTKKLIKVGNSEALVIDKIMKQLAGINCNIVDVTLKNGEIIIKNGTQNNNE